MPVRDREMRYSIYGNQEITTGTVHQAETISGILTNSNFVSGRGGKRCDQSQISLIQLLKFVFEVKSTDNKNAIDNNITLFAFFCQLVKSLRRFSAVSSRSCSKWATNGSPLPVVRNQKLKGKKNHYSHWSQTYYELTWLKHAVIVFWHIADAQEW